MSMLKDLTSLGLVLLVSLSIVSVCSSHTIVGLSDRSLNEILIESGFANMSPSLAALNDSVSFNATLQERIDKLSEVALLLGLKLNTTELDKIKLIQAKSKEKPPFPVHIPLQEQHDFTESKPRLPFPPGAGPLYNLGRP